MMNVDHKDRGIEVSAIQTEDEKVEIAVTDHGCGISQKDKEMIFQPFFTTKSAGMGLGLAICQSIIESHGGVLRFKKNPPGGTIFSFTLPIIPETKA